MASPAMVTGTNPLVPDLDDSAAARGVVGYPPLGYPKVHSTGPPSSTWSGSRHSLHSPAPEGPQSVHSGTYRSNGMMATPSPVPGAGSPGPVIMWQGIVPHWEAPALSDQPSPIDAGRPSSVMSSHLSAPPRSYSAATPSPSAAPSPLLPDSAYTM